MDLGSVPWGPGADKYWERWRTTHVFFCLGSDTEATGASQNLTAPVCPPGWSSRSVTLSHWEAGGATTGRWTVVAWYPPLIPFSEPLPVIPQSWFPLFSYVKDRERALAHPSPPDGGVAVPRVVRVGGFVQDWGLFPASELAATVLVQCSASPSGYGSRRLTGAELGALWDMPISVLDALPVHSTEPLLQGILRSAPTKILFAGADSLLTASFRGGLGGLKTLKTGSGGLGGVTVGPRPRSNLELGLVPPTVHSSRPVPPVEVVKGDSQKADDAAVPDQLWLHAFRMGYDDPVCWARHCSALGLGCCGRTEEGGPPPGWQESMNGFRLFGLRVWRRCALRGYAAWRRSNIPWQSNLATPAQMVRGKMGMVFGQVRVVYEWTAKGRLAYNRQWGLLRASEDGAATVEAGHDAIRRCANSSWFEWLEGSAPLFWNWPGEYQRSVRDGQPHFLTGSFGPPYLRPQSKHKDPAKQELMRAKVVKVRRLGYIKAGKVESGTSFFSVDKGKTDIRMVYNGTSCGLNDVLYAPHFGLPTVRTTLRAILPGFFQCDLDVQDQFLNYKLHRSLREHSGVDVQGVRSLAKEDERWEAARPARWERWERNWMGLRDSPYRSLQWQVRLKMVVYGDRRNLANPFHWDHVQLNLPGSPGYRADLPWVMKIRADGTIAAEIFVYVDDGRAVGHSAELAWQAARRYAAVCAFLGVQDAARKRTSASRTPGPWAGTVTHTDQGQVCGMVSQEKWERTQSLIRELGAMVERDFLPLQRLLEIRGFLIYVVRTYPWLNPYLKGLHLTVDSWRPGREASGFKMRGKEREKAMAIWAASRGLPCRREDDGPDEVGPAPAQTKGEGQAHPGDEAPGDVRPVPRLPRDIDCLLELTKAPEPPRQLYRAKHVMAFFVIGDASGSGKGVAVVEQYGVDYEAGPWKLKWRKESSNVREAENLTDRVERLAGESSLFEHEVFVLTDNSAFEGAYYKGHSPSEKLNDIVFRLHKAERDGGFILHVLHISGKRMKATGVDGLSRGDLTEGLLAGADPFAFLPFDRGADERSNGAVSSWVRSWWRTKKGEDWGGLSLEEVTGQTMFELKELKAARLWLLAPAVMETALDLFRDDRMAQPQWPHVFVIPRLMTHMWRKDLGKDADVLFTVPAGVSFWASGQFEPLIVALVFPLAHIPRYTGPWLVRGTDEGTRYEQALIDGFRGDDTGELHELDGRVQRVWEDAASGARSVLQQLLAWAGGFPPVQKCLVRAVLPGGRKRPVPQVGQERGGKRFRPGPRHAGDQ
ncbi:hypothetical protein ACHAW5_001375 [Stephanodiscus triporus]|uniref:Uncharacterized protein n=1 Tax=Stephanodiscus triporus TaxID=2934178 RepID=A0ABD3PFI3_9STRA